MVVGKAVMVVLAVMVATVTAVVGMAGVVDGEVMEAEVVAAGVVVAALGEDEVVSLGEGAKSRNSQQSSWLDLQEAEDVVKAVP